MTAMTATTVMTVMSDSDDGNDSDDSSDRHASNDSDDSDGGSETAMMSTLAMRVTCYSCVFVPRTETCISHACCCVPCGLGRKLVL